MRGGTTLGDAFLHKVCDSFPPFYFVSCFILCFFFFLVLFYFFFLLFFTNTMGLITLLLSEYCWSLVSPLLRVLSFGIMRLLILRETFVKGESSTSFGIISY